MRIVLDTNILISGVIRPHGRVGSVLQRLRDGALTLLYDERTLSELMDVLNRPKIRNKYDLSQQDIETVLSLLLLRGEAVECRDPIADYRDPKDNKFLEVAFYGRADFIVSGGKDLHVLNPFRSIPIINPADFLIQLDQESTT